MNKLVDLFCDVDDFFKVFMPEWQKKLIENGERKGVVDKITNKAVIALRAGGLKQCKVDTGYHYRSL